MPERLGTISVPSNFSSVEAHTEYIKITPQEAQVMMLSGNVVILDVRTQDEFESGHIKNAFLLPYFEIERKAESMIIDKDQTVLVYCRTGRRS